MAWLEKLHHPEYYVKTFLKWAFLSMIVGMIGGLLGAAFHHALHFVTHVRAENQWLIYLLPAGGLLSVAIYRVLGMTKNRNRLVSVLLFVQLDLNKEMQHAGGTLRTLVQKLVFYSTVINLASSTKTPDSEQESGVFHSL